MKPCVKTESPSYGYFRKSYLNHFLADHVAGWLFHNLCPGHQLGLQKTETDILHSTTLLLQLRNGNYGGFLSLCWMSDLTCSWWSCQSYSKACVSKSVKKTALMWKKSSRVRDVRSEVPLSSLIFYRFQTIEPEKFLTLAHQDQVVKTHIQAWVLSYGSRRSLHDQKSYPTWQGLAPSHRSATASHLCLLPLQLPEADWDCSPLLLREGVCQVTLCLKWGLNWWKQILLSHLQVE